MLADQRRLVAPGEAVDDARRLRPAREQRAGDRVGLHIDHDDVLAVRDRRKRVTDAGFRHAGRLHDHLDVGKADQRFGVGRHVGAARLERIAQGRRREGLVLPAGGAKLPPGAINVEIGEADEMHAARAAHLGEEHGAELAGADQPDGHGAAGGLPLQQHGMQIHRPFLHVLPR